MKTKLALEIILWHPNSRPYDIYDEQVIEHFWTKLGYTMPKKHSTRLSDMHSQMRDEALTYLADLIDSIVK